MSLFDPEPYGPASKARTVAPPPNPPDTVVVLGGTWIGVSRTMPGVVHYIVGPKLDQRGNTVAAAVSACGLVVVPHTYNPTEQRPGCTVCAQRISK